MSKLVNMERISLKNSSLVKEDMIQEFIFNDPTVLGLGDITPIQREKTQPSGGRLDMLLVSDDKGTRYEVEIQLGATDPSHIIRTIEYWDAEKRRYPQYDHCAVIVAEEITGRFMNVIQLFNGAIPLIAIQLSAYKNGDDISLSFTKIIDRVSLANEDDEDFEPTDRNYWEKRSTSSIMKNVDKIFAEMSELTQGYEFKYNKFYIGMSKDGIVKNFIRFKPKKSYLYLCIRGEEDQEMISRIESSGLEVNYDQRWKEYYIKIYKFEDFIKSKELILEIVKSSMDYYNIND